MRATSTVVDRCPRLATRLASLLAWLCLLLAGVPAEAQRIPCVLKIVQLEAGDGTPFYMRCPGGPGVCRGTFKLILDGAERTAFVKAVCEHASVMLAFADESGIFELGSQNFTELHVPHSKTTQASLNLYTPLARLQLDSPNALHHLPVLRQSDRPVAKLRVDVWTSE
ncbi:MAG: hypothetical protein ACHQRJ_23365 [Alphaproteobacteria bacterium]